MTITLQDAILRFDELPQKETILRTGKLVSLAGLVCTTVFSILGITGKSSLMVAAIKTPFLAGSIVGAGFMYNCYKTLNNLEKLLPSKNAANYPILNVQEVTTSKLLEGTFAFEWMIPTMLKIINQPSLSK